jgi:hypothetical protein
VADHKSAAQARAVQGAGANIRKQLDALNVVVADVPVEMLEIGRSQ